MIPTRRRKHHAGQEPGPERNSLIDMSKRGTNDLTNGSILRKLLLVAIPIMGTQLMQMAYNLTDMFWLGQGVSSAAVAASGSAGMYLWLSMAFMLVGRLGAEIGVSQCLGRREPEEARRYAQNAVFLAMTLGIAFAAPLIIFSRPLIRLVGIYEAGLLRDAANYLTIVALGVPLTFVSGSITGMFNGAGNSRLSFWANAIGLAINMALDPLFIIGFKWGVIGAAIATVMAQAVVCTLFIVFAKKHKARPFDKFMLFARPEKAPVRQIFKWTIPVGLESMLFTLLSMATTRIAASFGQDALAVQRVGSQIESMSWLIGGGFGTAITAFVGQNFGAHKWARIREGFRIAWRAMLIWGIVVSGLLFFGGRVLYQVFIKAEETHILDGGAVYLRILTACQIFCCLEAVGAGMFRGLGKTIPPSVSSISINILRVPLAYLLSIPMGLDGVWWGVSLTALMRGALIFGWFLVYSRKLPRQDETLDSRGERQLCETV